MLFVVLTLWTMAQRAPSDFLPLLNVVLLLALLPAAAADAAISHRLLAGPIAAIYLALFLAAAYVSTPATLHLPFGDWTNDGNSRNAFSVAYLVAGVIHFTRRITPRQRKPWERE